MKPVGIARYVLHGTLEERRELLMLNRKLVFVRWFYVVILAVSLTGAAVVAHYPVDRIWQYIAIAVVMLSLNLALFLGTRFSHAPISYYHALSVCQILLDLTLGTLGTMVQGGIEARTTILFAIPIINAVMLFGSSALVHTSSLLSGAGYALALLSVELSKPGEPKLDQLYVPIFFYTVFFLIIGKILMYFNTRRLSETRERAYDELLALLSHQLRHPASTISAIVDTFEFDKKLKYDKATARYIAILKQENDRQIHLINNLLEVVSPDTPLEQLQATDIERILRDATSSQGIAHNRVNDIKLTFPDSPQLTVHGNAEKVRMVVDNLLDNALRYSEKGTIIEAGVIVSSKQVIITVSDHGVGILPEHRRQIFKKFGSTAAFDGEIHGAGLGMYVSEKIVKAYGGELGLKSSVGGGTQVTIKLQRTDND